MTFKHSAATAFCLSFVLIPVLGQERKINPAEVPPAVTRASLKYFPQGHLSNWSKEIGDGETTYEASVIDRSGRRDAVFSEDGSLVAIEQIIPIADLPKEVKNAVESKYPAAVLHKAEKIFRNGDVQYEVELAKAGRKEILFNIHGKILKEE
jgi:Putative beta-lactamase-inhibitor-like, PepSY-like